MKGPYRFGGAFFMPLHLETQPPTHRHFSPKFTEIPCIALLNFSYRVQSYCGHGRDKAHSNKAQPKTVKF